MKNDNPEESQQTGQLMAPIPTVENASSELTGGQGFSFEDAVAATYFVALLGENAAPGTGEGTVVRVALQQGPYGHPLDDLVVTARRPDTTEVRFDAQVKRSLTVSAAHSNVDFRDTILRAYQTVEKPDFQLLKDRVGAITGEISSASKRDFETLCEMARAESDPARFAEKIRTPDTAGQKLTHFNVIRKILEPHVLSSELDPAAHRLLSHFVLVQMDMLAEGSVMENQTIAQLAMCLPDSAHAEAGNLWKRLTASVRLFQGRAAGLDRKSLVASLKGSFRLRGAPSMTGALTALRREAELACAEISNQVGGVTVRRDSFADEVKKRVAPGALIQIVGAPGAGKSVVLRSLVERSLASGTTIFLKADRLAGSSWAQYALQAGLGNGDLESLLIEVATTGEPTLFVDGIDRIEVSQRKIVLDVVNRLQSSEHLKSWAVVVTVRDTGIEHIRTWLPEALLIRGVTNVQVSEFSNDEAKVLANALPPLSASLFGAEPLRSLARRPFFASILAKEARRSAAFPTSEIGLAGLWWKRGGYGEDVSRAGHRQNALVKMAQEGAVHLGRRISVREIDTAALAELVADGVVREVRAGHFVQFSHDIFFEWAFLQYLIAQAEDWPVAVRSAGEPPALGRVVELLSQVELVEGDAWPDHLARLEADMSLRSQWRRSWLVGPLSLPTFENYRAVFDLAVFTDVEKRAHKLLVWFQAEKTEPHPWQLAHTELDVATRIRFADQFAIPSDVRDWQRFCAWLVDSLPRLSAKALTDAFKALSVWQNLYADLKNGTSTRIVESAVHLLKDFEQKRRRDESPEQNERWQELNTDQRKSLETLLRGIVLRAARTQVAVVSDYFRHLKSTDRPSSSATKEVLLYAPVLVDSLPSELVDYCLFAFVGQLPVDGMRQQRTELHNMFGGIEDWEWDRLGLRDERRFLPAAPSKEPFSALFKVAPNEGRRLVRELANHAITAWRQLHRLSYRRRGTPVPLTLHFPWGVQMFWGGKQQYQWAVGHCVPGVVGSGLMALSAWAFDAVERGEAVDEVIRLVLEGNRCVGVLHLACVIALKTKTVSPTTLPLFTSQRIWRWDVERAVRAMNEIEQGIGDIRNLAFMCHMLGGEIAQESAAAIRRFEENLPFDTWEERADSAVVADHRRVAGIWAQIGYLENYRADALPDGKGIQISIDNPKAKGPDVDAAQAKHAGLLSTLPLQMWTGKYFDTGVIPTSMTIEQAVEAAKAFDRPDLFEQSYSITDWNKHVQGVVAGVAAVVCAEGLADELEWAVEVCSRALHTPEEGNDLFIPSSLLSNHPVQNAVHGIGALLKAVNDDDARQLQSVLFSFASAPYERIGLKALQGLLQAWSEHPTIAWEGLRLAMDLSIIDVGMRRGPQAAESEGERRERIVEEALTRLNSRDAADQALISIQALPPHWIPAPDGANAGRSISRFGRPTSSFWVPNQAQVHINFLKDILPFIPIAAALGNEEGRELFLDWCEGLARWTVQRAYPTRDDEKVPGLAGERPEVGDFEWSFALYNFLCDVSLHLPAEEAERRFVASAAAADDKTFGHLVMPFASRLACAIVDKDPIPTVAIPLLQAVLVRVMKCSYWGGLTNSRRSISETDLSFIIDSIFFSGLPKAGLAKRYVNGDWKDVTVIFTIFEPVLVAQGCQIMVASAWLSLCEKAFDNYPAEHFIKHLKHLFPGQGQRPAWHGTTLVARLAGLIQRFSERKAPLQATDAGELLRALDELVDMGDRRAAAVQMSEVFRSTRRSDSAARTDM
ncbi:MAG: hypothetical protein Q8K34_15465 [Hydrogenophaga sp.]|nr:hypothetical protein [Hydrogenophaga sp.]